jgi:hypothetical protein
MQDALLELIQQMRIIDRKFIGQIVFRPSRINGILNKKSSKE